MQKPFTTQPELFISSTELNHPSLHALDDTEAVLDWSKIELMLAPIYASQTGRPSYPLLTLFRGLLLGVWYRLSDVQLSQCLYRDLLFRKFCHLELGGDVPEASTLGRFRNQLVEHDLWERLLGEINVNQTGFTGEHKAWKVSHDQRKFREPFFNRSARARSAFGA